MSTELPEGWDGAPTYQVRRVADFLVTVEHRVSGPQSAGTWSGWTWQITREGRYGDIVVALSGPLITDLLPDAETARATAYNWLRAHANAILAALPPESP